MIIGATIQAPEWDVIVIGAGPGGGAAALHAARLGVRTLLVDKANFPRDKPCGCCVNGAAVSELEAAGVAIPFAGTDGAWRSIELHAFGSRLEHEVRGSIVVDRALLDGAIVRRAVELGAEFLPGTPALPIAGSWAEGQPVRLGGATGRMTSAAVVIVATGLTGVPHDFNQLATKARPASLIGLWGRAGTGEHHLPKGRLLMAAGEGGYVGAVTLPDGTLNLAAALRPGFIREAGGAAGAIAETYRRAGASAPVDDLKVIRYRGTPALTARPERVAEGRILLVGDAAGYVEPFTGEGIAWALAGGSEAAKLAARAVGGSMPMAGLAAAWRGRHHRLIGRRQMVTRLIAALLRRPALARAAVGLPAAGASLARLITLRAARPYHQPV